MATKKEVIALNQTLVRLLRQVNREAEDGLSEPLQLEIESAIIQSEEAI